MPKTEDIFTGHPKKNEEQYRFVDSGALSSGRVVCPKCGAKGVGYAGHPHAFGYKDYNRATCRYCRSVYYKRTPKKKESS